VTEVEATQEITKLYEQFIALQASDTLRRTKTRLAALPEVFLYPVETRIPSYKKAAVESVLGLLHGQQPNLQRAKLRWFTDADAEDLAIWKRCQQQGIDYPYEHMLDDRPLNGLCDAKAGEIWIRAGLDGSHLIATTAHEVFHWMNPAGSEDEALAFGHKAAGLLCPRGGLFFKEEHRYNGKAGDSILVPHGSKSWIRILCRDGSMEWHRPLEQYELFVAGQPTVQ